MSPYHFFLNEIHFIASENAAAKGADATAAAAAVFVVIGSNEEPATALGHDKHMIEAWFAFETSTSRCKCQALCEIDCLIFTKFRSQEAGCAQAEERLNLGSNLAWSVFTSMTELKALSTKAFAARWG